MPSGFYTGFQPTKASVKHLALLLSAFLLAPTIASADSVTQASQLSAIGGLSLVAAPVVLLSVPVVLVSGVLEASAAASNASAEASKVRVEVTLDKGGKETIYLPKTIVDKADLKAGDRLTVKPTRSGALLSKNEMPLAYLVAPENTKLSRSHELAR